MLVTIHVGWLVLLALVGLCGYGCWLCQWLECRELELQLRMKEGGHKP